MCEQCAAFETLAACPRCSCFILNVWQCEGSLTCPWATWLKKGGRPSDKISIIESWSNHITKDHAPNRSHVGNGTYSGPYAFTLTKSPKDPQTVSDMLAAVRKLMAQKSCKVKRYAWYLEYKGVDDAGLPAHPHIHGMYETESGGRIETRHFKRAWSLWDPRDAHGMGFRGGYHRPIKDAESYSEYIAKDGGIGERSE